VCVGIRARSCFLQDHFTSILHSAVSLFTTPILEMGKSKSSPNTPAGKDKPSKPSQSKDYYDEKGDLEISSSDGMMFKVHAYRLQASS